MVYVPIKNGDFPWMLNNQMVLLADPQLTQLN